MSLKNALQLWRRRSVAFLAVLLLGLQPTFFQLAALSREIAELKPFAELDSGTATTLKISTDGASLATFRTDVNGFFSNEPQRGMELVIWDVATGKEKLKVADGWYGFAFSSDGKSLVVWTRKEVSIFDAQTGKRLATLDHGNVMDVQFVPSENLLVTETRNWKGMERIASELRFWSTTSWERVETKIDQRMPLTLPIVSPDGRYAAGFEPVERSSRNRKLKLKLWEIETGKELAAPNTERELPVSIVDPRIGFSPSGKELFDWGMLWDIETAVAKTLPEFFDYYLDVDQRHRYGGQANKRARIINGKIVVWDLLDGKQIAKYTNPLMELPIDAIPFPGNQTGLTIPSVFDDVLSFTSQNGLSGTRTIDLFEMVDWKVKRTMILGGFGQAVDGEQWKFDPESFCVRVARDGNTIVVLEAEIDATAEKRRCKVTAYDLKNLELKYQLEGHNDFVSLICLSPDGHSIVTGSGSDKHWAQQQGEVKLWDMASGKLVRTLIDKGGSVHCLSFDNRGDSLAIGRYAGEQRRNYEVGVWRTSTGAKLYNLKLPLLISDPNTLDQPHSLAFSRDDKLLAVGGHGQLSMWEMPGGKFHSIARISGPVDRLHFSDNGKNLYLRTDCVEVAKVSEQGLQQHRGVITENFQPTEHGRGNGGGDTAFSIPDRLIATCPPTWQTNGGEISLWDVKRKQLHQVICHEGVQSMDFSSTGQLVTASIQPESNITTVLDLKTGRELLRLGHFGFAMFSPTGDVFAKLKKVPRSVKVLRDPQGSVIVEKTPSGDGVFGGIELWASRTGRKLGELPHDAIEEVHFALNGKVIASFARGSVKLWLVSDLFHDAVK